MPGAHNKYANALAKLASKFDVPNKTIDVQIMKSTLWAIVTDLFPNSFDVQEWRSFIIKNLN